MLLQGKPIVEELKTKVIKTIKESNRSFAIAIIAPSSDKASLSYIKTRENLCLKLNIKMQAYVFNKTSEQELIELINKLNKDDSIQGIMVDRPLPAGINEKNVFDAIDPNKDIDGCSSINAKLLKENKRCLVPSTAEAVNILLDYYKLDVTGKNVAIVNNSIIVGQPLAQLLSNQKANVVVCDKTTPNIKEKCQQADIVITAIGKANYFDKSYFDDNAIVIDVGINVDDNGNVCGDVDKETSNHVKMITPVPGGVGPITNVVLLTNMLKGQNLW